MVHLLELFEQWFNQRLDKPAGGFKAQKAESSKTRLRFTPKSLDTWAVYRDRLANRAAE